MILRSTLLALAATVSGAFVTAPQSPVDRMVGAQLAAPTLSSTAAVSLDLSGKPFGEIVAAVADAAGITVRYHSAVTGLQDTASAKMSNSSAEDALRTVLGPKRLALKVTGSKSVFVYPDTTENRDRYADSVKTFTIAKADVGSLMQTLNQAIKPGSDELRPTIVSDRAARTIAVRATPDMMTRVAKLIADNDK